MQEIIIHNWDELQRAVFDDVWDEKIFDPLPLAAEHTAQIRDRVAVFRADQRKNFSCHRFCRAVLGDRLDGVEELS